MKVTFKWLQEFVDIPWSPEELADKLTLSGSEVEAIEKPPKLLENVIIGSINHIEPHPHAALLKICKVNLGTRVEQIICGAPNVRIGQRVPVALPGALLPSGQEIKSAKIRGVASHGMICSEYELGLSDVADKIMELSKTYSPGNDFDPGNLHDDLVLDIFINPNRPDCMSVRGIAREVAALSGKPLHALKSELPTAKKLPENRFLVKIIDTEKCPRYCGAIITGIKVKPSSYFIQQRLFAVGVRPINNIVDATNYCLMELGQPLHAFDLRVLKGRQIIVKTAQNGQLFITLDNEKRILNEDVLMICDRERAVAIGGIMGGLNSEIQNNTENILLESAYFNPMNIRRSSKYLGISTEASRRFERGLDPSFCLEALKRLCALILQLSPGQLYKPYFDVYPKKFRKRHVSLRPVRLNAVLGTEFSKKQIEQSLKRLDIAIRVSGKNTLQCTIPPFRNDLFREIDLIEETARIIGLDKIESRQRATIALRNVANPQERVISKIRSIMTEFGFVEVYNYSMIDMRLKPLFRDRGKLIELKNPISPEFGLMRPTLIPGLLHVALFNKNRGIENLRIFELGKVYANNLMGRKGMSESHYLGGIIYGQRVAPSWDMGDNLPTDIFTVKGILESFLRKISLDIIEIISYDNHYMEQACSILAGGKSIGSFGSYRNGSLNISFNEPIFLFELDADSIIKHVYREQHYKPYSKYPPAKRELSFVIPNSLPVQKVINSIKKIGGPLLKSVTVEDVYKGKPVASDSRSVRMSFKFYASDRSLLDNEVEDIVDTIISDMHRKHKISIRM